jgi:hypothetical protein
MAEELDRDAAWRDAQVETFRSLASGYLPDVPGGRTSA